jgi:hypothetical protein
MMPSLFKYFTIVGGGLLGLLIALNAVMQPGGPGPSLVNVAAPKAVVVKHDPQASRVERLRAEEAALKTTLKTELSSAIERAHIPLAPPPTVIQVSEQPASEPMISPTALTSTPTEDEATRAAQFAQEKLKAERARKKRPARERAKALEEAASRQQDQMYYGYTALDALQRRDRRPAAFAPMVR